MRILKTCLFVMAVSLVGCVASVPQKSVQEVEASRDSAFLRDLQAGIAQSDKTRIGFSIESLLESPNSGPVITGQFAKSPRARELFLSHLEEKISETRSPTRAKSLKVTLGKARAANVLTKEEADRFLLKLRDVVVAGNRSGTIEFTLLDLNEMPELSSPEDRRHLASRSVAAFNANSYRPDQLLAILDYLKAVTPDSNEGQRIADALLSSGIRRSEIVQVENAIPRLATGLRQRLFVKAYFTLKGGDRLLADDVKRVLQRSVRGAIWVESLEPGAVTVSVEKVRHDERTLPERRDTVTYSQYQVNLASAVLLMPRNASYLYDISSSGSAIEYGYVVAVEGGTGTTRHEEVVRGTTSGEEIRCSNARIQNVFGGVQAANFVANEDMAARCGGGNGKTMSRLRDEVYEAVAAAIKRAPQFSRVADRD